jgi:hypothetical protein
MRRTVEATWLCLLIGTFAAACARDAVAPIEPARNADRVLTSLPDADREDDGKKDGPFTLAVIGDTPYGDVKLAEFPSLVSLINADRKVEMVLHAGDIKAGKNSPCTDQYFETIRALFDTFVDPLVYTPGDNEWTDCHVASKNNGLFTPTERLVAVRKRFFPVAGRTLGQHARHVLSQASDPANSAYVENTMWARADVVFAALNITGSNNDGADWGTPLPADAGNYPSQAQEQTTRARANSAWLNRTFALAREEHARGVVLLFQADMWDTSEPTLSGYDALVQQIGTLAANFGKPVLLLEGDSHVFNVDHPFTPGSPFFGVHLSTPVAENITRIVVEGSDKGRTEYLRLTINPKAKAASLFTWERVPLQ